MTEQGDPDELRAFLSKLSGRPVELTDVGPASHRTAIGRLAGYPHDGLTTFVTCGASPRAVGTTAHPLSSSPAWIRRPSPATNEADSDRGDG